MPAPRRVQDLTLEEVLSQALTDALPPPEEAPDDGPELFVHTPDGRTMRRDRGPRAP